MSNRRYSSELDLRMVHDEDSSESSTACRDGSNISHRHGSSSNSSIDAAQIDVAEKMLGGGTPHVTLYPGMFQMMVRSSNDNKKAREKRRQQLCVSTAAPMSAFTIEEGNGNTEDEFDEEDAGGCRSEKETETTSQALIRKA